MNTLGQAVPYPCHGADEIGAGSQMRHFAQVFATVTFGLHGVTFGIVNPTQYRKRVGLQLDGLPLALAGHQGALDLDGTACPIV